MEFFIRVCFNGITIYIIHSKMEIATQFTIRPDVISYVAKISPDKDKIKGFPARLYRVAKMLEAIHFRKRGQGPVGEGELRAVAEQSFVDNAQVRISSIESLQNDPTFKQVFANILSGDVSMDDFRAVMAAVQNQTQTEKWPARQETYAKVLAWFVRAAHKMGKNHKGRIPWNLPLPDWIFGKGLGGGEIFGNIYRFD